MKKMYNISLCALLLLLFATACHQPHTPQAEKDSDVIEQIWAVSRYQIPADSIFVLLDAIRAENEHRMTNNIRVSFYNTRGLIYLRTHELEAAETDFLKALHHLEQLDSGDLNRRGRIMMNIGHIHRARGAFQKAIDTYRQSALYADGDSYLQTQLYLNIGLCFGAKGEIETSLYYTQLALDRATEKGSSGLKAAALQNLSHLLTEQQNFSQAEEVLLKIISIFTEIDNLQGLWVAYYHLAIVLIQQDRSEEGLRYIQKSNEIAAARGFPQVAMSLYYKHRGRHYFEEGDYRSSLAMFYQALEWLVKLQDTRLIAETENSIATIYSKMGNFDQALLYANRALQVAQKGRFLPIEVGVHRNLIDIHAARGDIESVKTAIEAERRLRDKLFTEQNTRALHEMQTRYEREIDQLLIAQKTEEIRRQHITNLFLLFAFIVFIAASVLYTLFQRKKMQNVQRSVQQYEELLKYRKEASGNIAKDGSLSEMSQRLIPQIERLFKEEKVYLQSGLTVDEVAKRLNSNRNYLSTAINEGYQKRFPEFVNTFRIDDAIEMFKEMREGGKYAHYTIQAVGEEVGFKGKTTFFNVFKQIVGVAPSEYLKMLKEKK